MKDWVISPKCNEYSLLHTSPESELLQKIARETQKRAGSQMLSGRLVGAFIQFLIKTSAAKRVLDIGTFTGYSALTMAEALTDDGKVITIESSQPVLEIAQTYFAESPHQHKIQAVLGDALAYLASGTEIFDLIFIDADKSKIKEYYEQALSRLRAGGVLVIDDVLWRGEVVDENPSDKRAQAMKSINEIILNDPRVENVLLPIRHGLNVVRKLKM